MDQGPGAGPAWLQGFDPTALPDSAERQAPRLWVRGLSSVRIGLAAFKMNLSNVVSESCGQMERREYCRVALLHDERLVPVR